MLKGVSRAGSHLATAAAETSSSERGPPCAAGLGDGASPPSSPPTSSPGGAPLVGVRLRLGVGVRVRVRAGVRESKACCQKEGLKMTRGDN